MARKRYSDEDALKILREIDVQTCQIIILTSLLPTIIKFGVKSLVCWKVGKYRTQPNFSKEHGFIGGCISLYPLQTKED